MDAKERIGLNKWKADLLIREAKAEDKGLMRGLMISEQKPGQSPGDDRTKEPYDKDWPPPAPLKPRLAHAGPGQFYDEEGNVTDTHPYKFNRNTTELEVPWLKEQYYDDLPRREQMHERLDHSSLIRDLQIAGNNAPLERVTEKGYIIDAAGDAYINTPDGLINDGEYDPDIHGLYVPLAERQKQQRSKLKIRTA